jgi:lipopolysaccharide export LptBFGC system permease protein LptF
MNRNLNNSSNISLASSIWKLVAMLVLLVFITDTLILPNLDQNQNTVLIEFNGEENDSEEEKEEKEKDGETEFLHIDHFSFQPIFVSSVIINIWNNTSLLSHSWDLTTPPPDLV